MHRGGGVAGSRERAHETKRGVRVIRIVRREAAPPLGCLGRIPFRFGGSGKRLERTRGSSRQPVSFAFLPAVELGRVGEKEAVEERSPIERHRALQLARRKRRLELPDVHTPPRVGELDPVADGLERVLAERLADRVYRYVEKIARVLRVAVGPQKADKLVAAERAAGRSPQKREEGDLMALSATAGRAPLIRLNDGVAEQLERKHRASEPEEAYTWSIIGYGASAQQGRQPSADVR